MIERSSEEDGPGERSQAIVSFIASLAPLFLGEHVDSAWCARETELGTLIRALPEDPDGDVFVAVSWAGQAVSEQPAEMVATNALMRYVIFHTAGHPPDTLASELHFLSQHFEYKTNCSLYLPSLPPLPTLGRKVMRAAGKMGEGMLAALLSKVPTGGL